MLYPEHPTRHVSLCVCLCVYMYVCMCGINPFRKPQLVLTQLLHRCPIWPINTGQQILWINSVTFICPWSVYNQFRIYLVHIEKRSHYSNMLRKEACPNASMIKWLFGQMIVVFRWLLTLFHTGKDVCGSIWAGYFCRANMLYICFVLINGLPWWWGRGSTQVCTIRFSNGFLCYQPRNWQDANPDTYWNVLMHAW